MLEKYNVMSRMSNVAAGVLNRSQCNKAVVLLKQVAERGHMSSLFTEAFEEVSALFVSELHHAQSTPSPCVQAFLSYSVSGPPIV